MADIASEGIRHTRPAPAGQGRRRAAGIYGAIITAALLAAAGTKLPTDALVVSVVVTLVVYWLAEEYAELLGEQNRTGEPDLVPVRHGRMMISPFTFYRGATTIMAADLAGTPVAGLGAQLCGDAHLSNFGAFASPERTLVFDVNDFDGTLPGPFEYDVKRMRRALRPPPATTGSPSQMRVR